MPSKRFRIALSFAGAHRPFVAQVADLLATHLGQNKILYDKYHEAEFAQADLAWDLPDLYHRQTDLIVVIFCPGYLGREWCGLEWRAIYGLIKQPDLVKTVMLSRFQKAEGKGLYGLAGFVELDDITPAQFAALILERLARVDGTSTTTSAHLPHSSFAITHSSFLLPPYNLPGGYIGQLFLGREDFLKELHASLEKTTHATAITQQRRQSVATGIEGLGGLGKTHAAVEYAHRHRHHYSALLFVSGDTPQRLDSGLAALCEVLPLQEAGALPPEQAVRIAAVLHWLASHHDWFLIVDNVDDEAAALALTAYFDRLQSGHVLITSRLHGFSRQVATLDLSVLSQTDSTSLLLQLTHDDRRKAADDDTQARALARLMEGLPLALHQAAGYINEQRLTFAQYLARYEQEAAGLLRWFSTLSIPYAGPGTGPDALAPRPVLITWKTSFDRLDANAKKWLLVFSHFAPDSIPEFLLEDALDATPEVKSLHRTALDALAQAEKISLLTRDDDPPRFKLHRLVQHVTRLTATAAERAAALELGIQLMADGRLGDPQDVRTWPKWTPLQPHALALCQHAPDDSAPQRLTWLLGCLSLLLQTKSLFDQAEPLIRRALKIEEDSHGPENPAVAIRLNNLAGLLQDTNRLAEAEPLLIRVVKILDNEGGEPHPNYSAALSNLAGLLYNTNRVAEAEPLMHRVLKIDEANYGLEHPKVAIALNNLAQLLQATYRLAEAEPLMHRALKIDEASYGSEHPNVAIHLNNLAQLLKGTNRLTEAEPLMRRALQIDEVSYGQEHPNVALRLNNLAGLLQDTNRLTEAEPLMRRALQIDEASYGSEHPMVAIRLNNLAGLLQATNRLAEAEPLMCRALQIDEASYGPEHFKVAIRLNNLAGLLQDTNRLAEAEPLMHRALDIDEASYGPEHPKVALRLNNLASLLLDTNRLAEAEPLMARAFGILVRSLGLEHPNSQTAGGSYIGLLQALELPEEEIGERVRSAMG